MKKIITILAIIFTTGTAFANTVNKDNVTDNHKALATFNKEFAGAANVTWFNTEESTVAKFSLKDSKITAHFNKAGELIATSRYITDTDLPLNVINKLIKRYPNQNIRNIVEYNVEGETTYVISLESDTQWTILKAQGNSPLVTLKKLQKS